MTYFTFNNAFILVAAQMWGLARFPSLIIGHKVPKTDKNWDNFLLLLTIMDYLLAPVISDEATSYLKTIIEDHHHEFKRLYPTITNYT